MSNKLKIKYNDVDEEETIFLDPENDEYEVDDTYMIITKTTEREETTRHIDISTIREYTYIEETG